MPDGTEIVTGRWWAADYAGPPLVSIDEEIAAGYGVGLGDTLTFNVLGRNLEAKIASIRREVDWSGGRLDFLFIVNPAALAGAPHTFVAAVDVPEAEENALLDQLATRLANVTPITLREVIGRATEVLDRVELAVDIVAGLTLGGGILALAGGILAARQRQRYETVVLKVLGARRGVLMRAFLIEYLVIGLAVALVGGLLGSLAAWLVATQLMTMAWSPAILALASVLASSVLAVVVVGGASLRRLDRPSGGTRASQHLIVTIALPSHSIQQSRIEGTLCGLQECRGCRAVPVLSRTAGLGAATLAGWPTSATAAPYATNPNFRLRQVNSRWLWRRGCESDQWPHTAVGGAGIDCRVGRGMGASGHPESARRSRRSALPDSSVEWPHR